MPNHSQSENVLWGGTPISAIEHSSELVANLDKLGIRGHDQIPDLLNDPVVQSELGVANVLAAEPFRDLLGRKL